MLAEKVILSGIVRGGVIIPDTDTPLPEGTYVEIRLLAAEASEELRAEFAAWERASDDAWGIIDTWEKEDEA